MYRILLTNSARKDLDRLLGGAWERTRDALLALQEEPRPRECRELLGGAYIYRIKIGDYRDVYDIDDDELTVLILRVRHRREIYREI